MRRLLAPLKNIALSLVTVIFIAALPNSYHFHTIEGWNERQGPSLIRATLENKHYANSDPGALLGIHKQVYEQSSLSSPLLWTHSIGTGRPILDGYNYGFLDPIQTFVKSIVPSDFIKYANIVYLLYIFVFAFISITSLKLLQLPLWLQTALPALIFLSSGAVRYPGLTLFVAQLIVLTLTTSIIARLATNNFSRRHLLLFGLIGVFHCSSASFTLIPYAVALGAGLLFLACLKMPLILLASYIAGGIGAVAMAAPTIANARLFQSLSTNPDIKYLGYGLQPTLAWQILKSYAGVNYIGLAILICSVILWANRSLAVSAGYILLLAIIGLLGIAGAFDNIQNAVGMNMQAVNTYQPILFFALSLLMCLVVRALLLKFKNNRPIVILSILATIGITWRSPLHRAQDNIVLIDSLDTPSSQLWEESPQNLGIADNFYRVVSLHGAESGDARQMKQISSESVNWFYCYPLLAPLIGISEATGGASLTPRSYADFLDVINYGVPWGSTRHPSKEHLTDYQKLRASGAIGHSGGAYGAMAQQRRNNLLIWHPYSNLVKYTGTKYLLSAERLHASQLFFLIKHVSEPRIYGREFKAEKRTHDLYVYELAAPIGKAWFPEVIVPASENTEKDLTELEAASANQNVAYLSNSTGIGTAKGGTILDYTEVKNGVEVRLRADAAGLLALSILRFPGWVAEVNGSVVEIVGVNHAFMGVSIPSGESRLTLRFNPDLKIPFIISAIGFLVCLSAALACRRQTNSVGRI